MLSISQGLLHTPENISHTPYGYYISHTPYGYYISHTPYGYYISHTPYGAYFHLNLGKFICLQGQLSALWTHRIGVNIFVTYIQFFKNRISKGITPTAKRTLIIS